MQPPAAHVPRSQCRTGTPDRRLAPPRLIARDTVPVVITSAKFRPNFLVSTARFDANCRDGCAGTSYARRGPPAWPEPCPCARPAAGRGRAGGHRGHRRPGRPASQHLTHASLPCRPLSAWDSGRIRLAVDVSNWLRPDAKASPERLFCHCYARRKGNAQMIPGWPYSFVAAPEPGRTSWTLPLDAVRPGPAGDATAVTAAKVREVVMRIIEAVYWRDCDPASWSSSTPAMT